MELLIFMVFVTIIVLSGMTLGYLGSRRKHKLELQREERRRIEAQTKQIEARNKQAEIEYRKALAELERFDRRGTGAGGNSDPAGQLPAGREAVQAPTEPP